MIDSYYKNIYEDREAFFKHSPYYLEQKIMRAITMGNEAAAIETLHLIATTERSRLAEDPLRSAKNSMICSCTSYARAAISAGIAPDIAFAKSDGYIQNLERFKEIKGVLDYEEVMLLGYVRLVQEYMKASYPPAIMLVMQYIESHLARKISLDEIAEHVHLHPNYLSSLFKAKLGISITQYTNLQRIKEASYYVAYTDYSIADIAELYQFCNQSYFISLFKKQLGQTPAQYKKSIQILRR